MRKILCAFLGAAMSLGNLGGFATACGEDYSYNQKQNQQFWTPQQLENEVAQHKYDFSFDNSNKPSQVALSLPEYPHSSRPAYAYRISGDSSTRYKIQAIGNANLEWSRIRSRIKRGYLLFQRSEEAVHHWVSTVTHVGMVWDPNTEEVFESQPVSPQDTLDGVYVRPYSRHWKTQSMWSVRKLKTASVSENDAAYAVAQANVKWQGIPYWPKGLSRSLSGIAVLPKWFDKEKNLGSPTCASCSKLTWWTFRHLVDLDSERTCTRVEGWTMPAFTRDGRTIATAWIGVSPDDIYYSQFVDKEIDMETTVNWIEPIGR